MKRKPDMLFCVTATEPAISSGHSAIAIARSLVERALSGDLALSAPSGPAQRIVKAKAWGNDSVAEGFFSTE